MRRLLAGGLLFAVGVGMGLLLAPGRRLALPPVPAALPVPAAPADAATEMARLRAEVAELSARAAGPVRVVEPVRVGEEVADSGRSVVRVHLVTREGTPVPGREVAILRGDFESTNRTGADGTMDLPMTPGPVEVRIPFSGGARSLPADLVPGHVTEVTLVAPGRGVEVAGRVIDRAGFYVAGRNIHLHSQGGIYRDRHVSKTGTGGTFCFPAVDPGPCRIWVDRGHPVSFDRTVPAGGLADLLLEVGVVRIRGVVRDRDTGAPIPGATVRVDNDERKPWSGSGDLADAVGAYGVCDLPAGLFALSFWADGYLRESRRVCLDGTEVQEVDVALALRAEVTVTILDAGGAPFRGAVEVTLGQKGGFTSTSGTPDAEGRIAPGAYFAVGEAEIRVEAPSEAGRAKGTVRVRLEPGENFFTVRLE